MTNQALLCDAVRTPIGRYGGSLSSIRTDDLAAIPLRALVTRTPQFDWAALDDVWLGCANQAGEDNRNIARMSSLLAGLPMSVPGVTLNRLCGSGMDAVGSAARAIKSGEIQCAIAGGVESMSRAPFVFGKAGTGFDRTIQTYDTTIGWRFVNKAFQKKWGTDSMPETAENVYSVTHSSAIYLVDPLGQYAGIINPPFEAADVAEQFSTLFHTSGAQAIAQRP